MAAVQNHQAERPASAFESAAPSAAKLGVHTWSTDEFAASRRAWDELLQASDADPLFMSWDWQWRWWTHHAEALGARLHVLAVYAGGTLIAIAPLYSRRVVVRGLFRSRRWELIGTTWRDPQAVFSDYLDIIVRREHRRAVLTILAEWLDAEAGWDELVLCCIKRDSAASELVRSQLSRMAYLREVDPLNAWCAHLPARFEDYVERLTSDARRKLFNHRRKLLEPRIQYAAPAEIPDYLGSLWARVSVRWGPTLSPEFRKFHFDLAADMALTGRLRLSRLITGAGPLSFMYNIRAGDTVYYLQSGFDAARVAGVSPGYLHFGYQIEASCAEGATRFDLLAGPGRHRDYKRDLATEEVPVVTYHAVRGGLARTLYRLHGAAGRCRKHLRFF